MASPFLIAHLPATAAPHLHGWTADERAPKRGGIRAWWASDTAMGAACLALHGRPAPAWPAGCGQATQPLPTEGASLTGHSATKFQDEGIAA